MRWNRVTETFTVISTKPLTYTRRLMRSEIASAALLMTGPPRTMGDQDDVGQIVIDDEIDN